MKKPNPPHTAAELVAIREIQVTLRQAEQKKLAEVITAAEAAELLNLDTDRVGQLCQRGELAARHASSGWLILRASVRAWKPRPRGRPAKA